MHALPSRHPQLFSSVHLHSQVQFSHVQLLLQQQVFSWVSLIVFVLKIVVAFFGGG